MSKNIRIPHIGNVVARQAKMLQNGRKEITTRNEMLEYEIGSIVTYMNKKNVLKNGGFLIEINENDFVYVDIDFDKMHTVKFKNILVIWIGSVFEVVDDIVSLVPSQKPSTNFPVTIAGFTIYYAKNNYDVDRFKATSKYNIRIQWCHYFLDNYEY
jgi:hypothetical protein